MQKKKKGFTLVELLVVIAILAILASVSVVGYLSFTKKAQESNDVSLTDQMNTVLQANEALDKADTLGEAIKQIKEDGGVDLELITPNSKGYNYAWDKKQNRILLLNESNEVVAPANLKDEATEDTVIIVKTKEQLEKAVNANYGVGIASSYTEDITTFNLLKEVSLDNYAGKIKTLNVKSTAPATYSLERNTNSNVYYSGVFENITLDESNGVTVYGKATTLDVKKNTGITIAANINKVVVSEGNVNVVEKAVVDFVDASKASNSSKVTINKTGTAVVGGVQAPEGNKGAVDGNIGSDIVVDSTPVTDFAGGLGTETSPYLISSENDLLVLSSPEKSKKYVNTYSYYKLVDDITLSKEKAHHIDLFNGELNGDNHSLHTSALNMKDGYSLVNNTKNAVFKNIRFYTNSSILCFYGNYSAFKGYTKFINVDVYGTYNTTNSNNESPYVVQVFGDEIVFEDCDAYYNLIGDGWQGVFLGGYAKQNIKATFKNLTYNGKFVAKHAGMLAGNQSNWLSPGSMPIIKVENCVNNGTIIAKDSASTGTLFVANSNVTISKFGNNEKELINSNEGSYTILENLANDDIVLKNNMIDFSGVTNTRVAKIEYVATTVVLWYENSIKIGNGTYLLEKGTIKNTSGKWNNISAKYASMSQISSDEYFSVNNDSINALNPWITPGTEIAIGNLGDINAKAPTSYEFTLYDSNDKIISFVIVKVDTK